LQVIAAHLVGLCVMAAQQYVSGRWLFSWNFFFALEQHGN
jgi:hypothetical protein